MKMAKRFNFIPGKNFISGPKTLLQVKSFISGQNLVPKSAGENEEAEDKKTALEIS
jgi:hypothetical protein